MKNFFPIFRAGRHVDSEGKVHNYSDGDVEALAAKYDPDWLSAPFSTDHKADGPAFGYAQDLKYKDGVLYASFGDMSDDLRDAVKQKRFGRVSIELFNESEKGSYLKAISLLGVKTPSIKGLEGEIRKQTDFSQTDSDHIIAFEADVSDAGVITLKDSVAPAAEGNPDGSVQFTEMTKKIAALEAERESLSAKFEQSEAERKKAQDRLLEISIDQQRLQFEQYLEERIAWGSVMPAAKEKIMELLMALDSVEKFSESDEKTPVEKFQDFLNDLPKLVDPETPDGKEAAEFSDPAAIAGDIIAYQQQQREKGREVSAADALQHLKNQNQNEK